MIRRLVLILPLLALWGCTHAPTQTASSESKPEWARVSYPLTQHYLPDGTLDIATALAPPPKPGSPGNARDFATLLRYQKTRTASQCARAASEVIPDLQAFYGPKYGPLTQKQVDRWRNFLDGYVRSDTDYYVQRIKFYWKRPRPYLANEKVRPCIRREGKNMAYPSGHATISEVYALILENYYGKLDPREKQAIEARNLQIGRDRVLGGVHHPSDVKAGRRLGKKIYRALVRSPGFERALANVSR